MKEKKKQRGKPKIKKGGGEKGGSQKLGKVKRRKGGGRAASLPGTG